MTLCDTNGSSLPAQVAEATAAVVAELGERAEVGIHAHNDLECGVANSLAAVEAGARMVQGTDQRLRRALRQRQPGLDPAGAAAEARLRVRARGPDAAADRDRALRRRAHQHDPGPRPALRRAQRVRPQGRHARRRGAGRRAHLRAHGPEAGRQQPRRADLRALGQGLGALARRETRGSTSTPTPPSARSSGSRSASTAATTTRPPTPRSTCCCAARRASTSRCSGSRASG